MLFYETLINQIVSLLKLTIEFDMGQRSIFIIGGYIKPSNKIEFLKFITISINSFFYATLNNLTHEKYRKDLFCWGIYQAKIFEIYQNIKKAFLCRDALGFQIGVGNQ